MSDLVGNPEDRFSRVEAHKYHLNEEQKPRNNDEGLEVKHFFNFLQINIIIFSINGQTRPSLILT